ncbi:MAG TPA: GNAT family N-acetyltransferase [Asanoa sp.]
MKPVEITADGLLLRPWRTGDADVVFRARQDPEVQRWTTAPSPYLRDTDLDGPQPQPDPVAARRAAVFAKPRPELFACTRSGEIRLRALQERAVAPGAPTPTRSAGPPSPTPTGAATPSSSYTGYGPGVWGRGTGAVFRIGDPADNGYRGVMELRLRASDPAVPDVGFAVAPSARGRDGRARRDDRVGPHRSRPDADRVAGQHRQHTASRRVAEKAGFRFEGTARAALNHRGKRVGAWVGAVLSTDAPGEAR